MSDFVMKKPAAVLLDKKAKIKDNKEGKKMNGDELKLNVGDKIWRPVHMFNWKPQIQTPMFHETEQGSWMGRAVLNSSFCFHKKRDIWVMYDNQANRGLVCFFNDRPHDDWTYFIVKGISKSGNVAFVQPIYGSEEELMGQYCLSKAEVNERNRQPNPKREEADGERLDDSDELWEEGEQDERDG